MERFSTGGQSGRGETRSESFNSPGDQSKTLTIKIKHQVSSVAFLSSKHISFV